jgi:hypothetical protein
VVEQLGSTSSFSELSEEEKEDLETINILKKPMKVLKWVDEPKEAQVAKEARKVMLQAKAEGIFEATREVVRLELEVEWAKMKA